MRTFFSLTLQVDIDVLEETFGIVVQRAYQHWLEFLHVQDDVLLEINQKHQKKQWENEFHFNTFVAKKILLPLSSGGTCLVNSDHEPALKKVGNMEKGSYLYYCQKNVAGRDWEWVRKILLLSSNTIVFCGYLFSLKSKAS